MQNDPTLTNLFNIFGIDPITEPIFNNKEYTPAKKEYKITNKALTGHITTIDGIITFVSIESVNGDLNLIFENVMDGSNFIKFIEIINKII